MYQFEFKHTQFTQVELSQLRLLCTTPVGTVVLDRDFGLDMSFVDMPPPLAATMMASELAEKIERYIPSLCLREVNPDGYELTGKQKFKVVVDRV